MVYTVKEVALMLRVSAETIKHLIYRGDLDAFKVGREWRIEELAIQKLKDGDYK